MRTLAAIFAVLILALQYPIWLGKGEASSGGREKTSILADAMEAVIGAVYLDGGWQQLVDALVDASAAAGHAAVSAASLNVSVCSAFMHTPVPKLPRFLTARPLRPLGATFIAHHGKVPSINMFIKAKVRRRTEGASGKRLLRVVV